VSALEAVQADASSPKDGVAVPLVTEAGEVSVTVPPPGRWRTKANRALKDGDFDLWAELVLSEDDFQAWLDAEPVNDDVETFFEAWGAATGENSGKSRPSGRSSRSTARR
jgi:hypothetical protein